MNHDIVIIAEQRDLKLQKISLELIYGARDLARQTGGRVIAVIAGFRLKESAEKLAEEGSDEVWVIDSPFLETYRAKPYAEAVSLAIKKAEPEIVLFGSTMTGIEIASGAAARLNTGLVTDCTALSLSPEDGLLLMTRPNTDGISIDTFVCKEKRPQMATVRPGVLAKMRAADTFPAEAAPPDLHSPAVVPAVIRSFPVDFSDIEDGVSVISTVKGREQESDITRARVLVAGGRGIGSPEGFKTLRTLASLLDGQIACSRACVESGWIDASPQVGQTGKTVRPDLYLACGISGAFQHVTGMEASRLIISINKNPAAPIFDISDLGIVGSVEVLLPKLINALTEYQRA
ncbi:electron transfer flavoprotein subunit alpha/FixB family protein [Clostridium transplantifaecale]|uniref:electron transfer flavoprotein subunit alpha/FixB family protein n=1 Tax=Clostridium transplantifaecale TaxID=2479838 RepID=UPI000F631308|nr:electron transfer flavoprotein subunit alpha/FixB family protein [Clostridium transplantifaecale]